MRGVPYYKFPNEHLNSTDMLIHTHFLEFKATSKQRTLKWKIVISLKNRTHLDIMKVTLSDGHSGGGKIMSHYILRNWSGAANYLTLFRCYYKSFSVLNNSRTKIMQNITI